MQNSGIVLLNKPVKISSNSAVNKVKYLIHAKKAGHLGTLDPLASGVLPVTFGKATRLFDYFLKKDKTYKAIFAFGFETDTLDAEGEITNINQKQIEIGDIEKIISNFIGEIDQLPPKYSALKVNGQKAYDLARKGQDVELISRKVDIFDIKFKKINDFFKILELKQFFIENNTDKNLSEKLNLIEKSFDNIFEFEISCGAGTYIRSLCRDIASGLQTFGTMLSLQRTRCGKFKLENCLSFEDIENGNFEVIKVEDAIDLEEIKISSLDGKKLLCGQPVFVDNFIGQKKLYSENEFLGIASTTNGKLKLDVCLKED